MARPMTREEIRQLFDLPASPLPTPGTGPDIARRPDNYMSHEFMKLCFTCKREFPKSVDIFMYNDLSFCSGECRNKEMARDELTELMKKYDEEMMDDMEGHMADLPPNNDQKDIFLRRRCFLCASDTNSTAPPPPPPTDELVKRCFTCSRELEERVDIFMHKRLSFCSDECRNFVMALEGGEEGMKKYEEMMENTKDGETAQEEITLFSIGDMPDSV